jgi:hypothetical protein
MSTPTLYLPDLVGLAGKAGAGKDTVAQYLERKHGYCVVSFAAPIRAMLMGLLGHVGQHSGWITERELKERPIPGLGRSYRELAQTLGTEWGRQVLGESFWTDVLAGHCAARKGTRFVVTDVRFPNELQLIRASGGAVWQVVRHHLRPVRSHESETAIEEEDPDAVLFNTGTIEQLQDRIEALLANPKRRSA